MKKILLAIDASEASKKAITETISYLENVEAELTLISVVYEQPIYVMPGEVATHQLYQVRDNIVELFKESTEALIDDVAQKFEGKAQKIDKKVLVGRPAEEISKEANEGGYDLVVLGSRGLKGTKAFFLGTISSKVANQVKCSVLIVK